MRNNHLLKKSYKSAAALLITGMLISSAGCGVLDAIPSGMGSDGRAATGSSVTGTNETTGYEAPVVEEIYVEETAAAAPEEEAKVDFYTITGVDAAGLEAVKAAQEGLYAYSVMDESLHNLYAELVTIIEEESEGVKISTKDADELKYVFQCVFNDHPEYYWIDGYSYVRHENNGQTIYLTFTGKYIYTPEERRVNQVSIDAYVSSCLAGISQTASDYEKVKYVYDYLVNHTEYDLGAPDNQNILSVFLYGRSVCQGYAKAMQYLLGKLGVPCTMCVGTVITGEGHAWNLVNIDGAYYYTDVTWGDANYLFDSAAMTGAGSDTVNYDYLNITTEELLKTHTIDNVVPMPACSATAANYYVKENLYFTSADLDQVGTAFAGAAARGDDAVTLKCSDYDVFSKLYDELITNQKIFNYLSGDNVSYSMSEDTYSFIFWL